MPTHEERKRKQEEKLVPIFLSSHMPKAMHARCIYAQNAKVYLPVVIKLQTFVLQNRQGIAPTVSPGCKTFSIPYTVKKKGPRGVRFEAQGVLWQHTRVLS